MSRPAPAPRYVGGQAVVEGVMMRGERTWAVAVRTSEGDIEVEVHDAPMWAERWSKVPLLRGVGFDLKYARANARRFIREGYDGISTYESNESVNHPGFLALYDRLRSHGG